MSLPPDPGRTQAGDVPSPREAERLRNRDDVQRALQQTCGERAPAQPLPARHKWWMLGYVLLLVSLAVLYYALRLDAFAFAERYLPLLKRATLGAMAVVLVFGLWRALEAFVVERAATAVGRYNLERVIRIVVYLVLALIVVSVLFANWYAAAASLGLISLVLGFALQTPITSVIGWLYILVREPYRVGDRICIGDATGDVIDVGYLDTTLWEVAGGDGPSGRLVKFPNANVLTAPVFNSSWPVFPYIWNEIALQVGYDADLAFVAATMREAAEAELGEAMIERVRAFREILAQTPVDEVQVQDRPSVVFRVSSNTWVEAVLRYLVEPRHAAGVRTRILASMLQRLNAEPERTRFPKGDSR